LPPVNPRARPCGAISLPGPAGHPRLAGVFAGFLNVVLFFPSGAIYPVESFPP
jgi:hypothetical protein